jgi:hypothetical protein
MSSKDLHLEEENEDLSSYKYLLGDFGIGILTAISRGAQTPDAIVMLSGVPMSCVKGRMPVLVNLKLVTLLNYQEYLLTQKGIEFLKVIKVGV